MQSDDNKPRLILFVSEDWFFLSHFLDRARLARQAGYRCIIVARDNGSAARIRDMGFEFESVPIDRRGLNPFAAIKDFLAVRAIFKRHRPSIVHNVALKPIVLGALAARSLGISRIVNAPVGMGYFFSSSALRAQILKPLLFLALKASLNPAGSKVVFENSDDLKALVESGTIRRNDARLIPGAGVDIDEFSVRPEPEGHPVVVLVARMLIDKGVREFVEAARILKRDGVAVRMQLVGAPDPHNRGTIGEDELKRWAEEGVAEWLGHRTDIAAVLANSHIACLPSYREGLPKVLLEAMASGKPIVTTDVPGCRQAVQDGVNGLIVPARQPEPLAAALASLCGDAALRHRLGTAGRKLAEELYANEPIGRQTLEVYREVAGPE